MNLLLTIFIVVVQRVTSENDTNIIDIPIDFMIGTASSAYQIEGAWNEDGKGTNIWDSLVHSQLGMIADGSTGDVAADSYNKWREDVNNLKKMQVDFYRFSISWARILPTGEMHTLNEAGINYYMNLIDELARNNITCMAVMYHWDLPEALQELGGWANPIIADFFEDYAYVLFKNFGDKVKWWITIVEPSSIANGYDVSYKYAPAVDSPQVGVHLASRTLLLAHARAYRLYQKEFSKSQQGKVGIILDGMWFEPANKTSEADQDAAEFAIQYQLGMFANPIFGSDGDYPTVVKDWLKSLSLAQGYPRSRLPDFTDEEKTMIKGSADFLGINYYTSRLVKPGYWANVNIVPDNNVTLLLADNWPLTASPFIQVTPIGIRKVLNWIKERYNNPTVLISENGYPDVGRVRDRERIIYIVSHMNEVMNSKNQDGCNVVGYTVWSFIDGFEWNRGYADKYGLYSVNFNDTNRPRTAKYSAYCLAEIAMNRKLPAYSIRHSEELVVDLNFFESLRIEPAESCAFNVNSHIFHVWLVVISSCLYYQLAL